MKKQLLTGKKAQLLAAGALLFGGSSYAQTISDTMTYTGGIQTFTVPCGVNSVFIKAWGAQGGSGAVGASVPGGEGGLGGYAEGNRAVSEGDVLNIFVGGAGATPTGGFNGGANGGSTNAGGGGGATDVRFGGTAESDRIITAGGGGGGGRGGCEGSAGTPGYGGSGDGGGGGVGVNGGDSPTSGGVAGGGFGGNAGATQGAAGGAGIGCGGFLGAAGTATATGTGGAGGAGQACCCFSVGSIPGGGGGGGGQIGGGGGGGGSAGTVNCGGNDKGAGGGGGGGSSYTGGVTEGVESATVQTGDGMLVISYEDPTPSVAVLNGADTDICGDETLTFTCDTLSEATSYVWTVTGGLTIESGQGTTSVVVSATGDGTIEVYGVNGTCMLSGPVSSTVTVNFHAIPVVDLTATQSGSVCGGEDITLTGTPAGGTYAQITGPASALTGNVFNAPQQGAWEIGYSYTDSSGCSSADTIAFDVTCMAGLEMIGANASVNVYPNPSNGNFVISSKLAMNGTIRIHNELGQLVYEQTVKGLNKKQVELKNLAPGIYQLTIDSDGQQFSGKLNITK